MDVDIDLEENGKPKPDKVYDILIVEDDPTDLLIISNRINQLVPKCNIQSATSVKLAYKILKAGSFDLIILDLNLPDSYGPTTVEEIRRVDKRTSIIVTTSMGTSLTMSEALRRGANSALLKSQLNDCSFNNILYDNLNN